MAGIYFHIPFCKKACHYCNFHFSTSLKLKNEMIEALLCELKLQKDYLQGEEIETIYFGGGTPSILDGEDIQRLINGVEAHFPVGLIKECTLEANPDDVTIEKIKDWKAAGINRLSIGIQSFYEEDLVYMNRAHNVKQATNCIRIAQENGISNLSIDLIFGYPLLSHEKWERNIEQVLQLGITHISCYAMTIEPKTALASFISKGKVPPLDDEQSATQYEFLMKKLIESGFEHYEISSFAKPGYKAVHNSNYWNDMAYVGIGPSAHSYIGNTRQWNVTNNALYIQSILNNEVPFEKEALTREQKINEYIMVRLRLKEGISIKKLSTMMNSNELALFIKKVKEYINDNMLILEGDSIQLTMKGKLHADGVSAILFH